MLRTQRRLRLILLLSILASCAILHAAPVDYRVHSNDDDDDIQKTLEHLARSGNMRSGSDLLQNGPSTDEQPQHNGAELDDGREGERWVPQGRDGEKMMELSRGGQQNEENESTYNQQGEHGENESDQQALDHRSKEEQLDQRTDNRQKSEVAEEVHTDEDQKDQPSDEEHTGDQDQEANDNQKSQTKDEDYPIILKKIQINRKRQQISNKRIKVTHRINTKKKIQVSKLMRNRTVDQQQRSSQK
uniref:Uncharacterized protein n=1 Tax=Globodera pallida TaxID=36090 RepID=A0A183CFT5_GLOPA